MNAKPFMNKSLRLFQLRNVSEPPPSARGIDLSIEWLLRQGGTPRCKCCAFRSKVLWVMLSIVC